MAVAESGWIVYPEPLSRRSLRLVCVPHAGAGISAYHGWAVPAVELGIELAVVRLPGRETRLLEPPIEDMAELVDRLIMGLRDDLVPPFAIYGHCSGALVAYELARRIRVDGVTQPISLFVSGRGAPHRPVREAHIAALPEQELVAELLRWGGADQAVLDHPELRQLLLPAVRADFSLVELATMGDVTVACPLVAVAGSEDDQVTLADLAEWESCAGAGFSLQVVNGGHFFIWQSERALLSLIRSRL